MELLTHLPWWVYLLALYLLKIGLEATRSKVVPMKKLVITPLIFLYLSVSSLLGQMHVSAVQIGVWAVAAAVGLYGGWLIVSRLALAYDKDRFLVRLPGTWSTVVVIVLVFSSKFYLGYTAATDPTHVGTGMNLLALAVSGFGTGVVTGRVVGYFYRFLSSTSVRLES